MESKESLSENTVKTKIFISGTKIEKAESETSFQNAFDRVKSNETKKSSKKIDILGLVSAAIHELKIVPAIDKFIPSKLDTQVSTGEAVSAIIMNYLGNSYNSRLYLTSSFFENVAVDKLIGSHIKPEYLNDDRLGRVLDDIDSYGTSMLFSSIMINAHSSFNLGKFMHLDSTSVSVYGEYEPEESQKRPIHIKSDSQEAAPIKNKTIHNMVNTLSEDQKKNYEYDTTEIDNSDILITYGHSKDRRPDLKQFIINLVCNEFGMPIFTECLDGNTSDKSSFVTTIIETKKTLKKVINFSARLISIADAALYTKRNILHPNLGMRRWISRVPEAIKEARKHLESVYTEWKKTIDGKYQYYTVPSEYAGIKQRWIIVFSPAAFNREIVTFNEKVAREKKDLEKILRSLSRQSFGCKGDAKRALETACKKIKFFYVIPSFNEITIKKNKKKEIRWKMSGDIRENSDIISNKINKLGKFIIATDILDEEELTSEEAVIEYKKQSLCEGNFKFFKNDKIQMSKVFLKKVNRIRAMMMIMILALTVARYIEIKIRTALEQNKETIPNGDKKQVKAATFAILQINFSGISQVTLENSGINFKYSFMSDLNDVQKKIIGYMGEFAENIYSLRGICLRDGFG